MLADIAQFVVDLAALIRSALWLSPDLARVIAPDPRYTALTYAVAVLAGVSLLVGQSVALFVNRVTPGRFVLSLLLNGILYILTLVIWALAIWLCAALLYGVQQPERYVIRMVCLGSAPLVLGFLILIPYLGVGIRWILYCWSLLIILVLLRVALQLGLTQALVCTGAGWLLVELVEHTVGQPFIALRNWVWRAVTRTPFDTNTQELVDAVTIELNRRIAARG